MGKIPVKKSVKDGVIDGSIRFRKNKGQHILKNPLVVNSMIDKAGIKSTDTILEIGSGTGNLTVKLLQKARKVYAFEIDPRMIAELQKRIQSIEHRAKLSILVGDAVKAKEWPKFDVCVANLPYKISSPFIGRLIGVEHSFRCAVVMLQKEFADRLLAESGSKAYSRLSVNAQFHFKIDHLMKISRNSFKPPPRVDSSVIRIEPRHPKPPVSSSEWDAMLRLVFARKNKTIASNLKSDSVTATLRTAYLLHCQLAGLAVDPPQVACVDDQQAALEAMAGKVRGLLQAAGLEKSRARSMDEDDLLRMLLAFRRHGIRFA